MVIAAPGMPLERVDRVRYESAVVRHRGTPNSSGSTDRSKHPPVDTTMGVVMMSDMRYLRDLRVGDTAVVTSFNHGPRTVRITKVGRKYLHTDFRGARFDAETGFELTDYSPCRLLTEEQRNFESAVDAARQTLDAVGVKLARGMKPERVMSLLRALEDWLKSGDNT